MSEDLKTNEYKIETITCPSCGNDDAQIISHLLDIPYYSDFVMINISCRECGFRTSDFMNMTEKDPLLMEYPIDDETDATTKVVRSTQGIVGIPELGIQIEPHGDGNTWIRNIEGILLDLQDKLKVSLKYSETQEDTRNIKKRMKELKQLLEFKKPFTIVVEDPSGNSLILPAHEEKLVMKKIQKNTDENT